MISRLARGLDLVDPLDYTAYVIAQLTRNNVKPDDIANFNLDADRGYGYLAWDWVRDAIARSTPGAFAGAVDPSTNTQTAVSEHKYPTPVMPGYGWNPADGPAPPPDRQFHPNNPQSRVRIRYIGREGKF